MVVKQINKSERQKSLTNYLESNPFYTDEEMAKIFAVSIQTIRLDRLELGIPELRERLKNVAERSYSKVKSLSGQEIVGELIDLELEKTGLSLLVISDDIVFQKTKIARGHHLFAQANSLAIALVNAPQALTGKAEIIYKRPVYLGEKVVAKASVKSKKGHKFEINVVSKSGNDIVFEGEFLVFAVDNKGGIDQ